jgi:GH25 family lysozyme M1 (1,4-beta-N-acetylmuramidase)
MRWVIDISVWNILSQWHVNQLIENGLGGVIIKAVNILTNDRLLDAHVNQFVKVGIPYGFYQWVDPSVSAESQAEAYWKTIQKYKPTCVWGDVEQYWSNWNQWRERTYNKSTISLDTFTAHQVYNHTVYYIDAMQQLLPSNFPFGIYSAGWFVNSWCPQLGNLLNNQYYWNASYATYKDFDQDKVCTWNEFHRFIENLPPEYLPRNTIKSHIRQFTSLIPLAGFPNLDINIVPDENVYLKLFGKSNIIPIDENLVSLGKYRVTALWGLRVRSSPHILPNNILRTLSFNTQVEVYKVEYGWGKISPVKEEWVFMEWLKMTL